MIEVLLAVAALTLIFCWRSACQSSIAECAIANSQGGQADPASNTYVPEDAVLRRHFITQVYSEIETSLSPRPSDSVLLRHHQALIMTKLEQRLAELGRLHAC
ncbi:MULTISPECIES: hypothetical protein [Methylomonas]|uniref:Uncharacterized protein n=2 Tax=Methylomonas TaxID=416 RepID=A0A126T3H6_9GAMM|nr:MULTISPECIES: hypothetical protein [Methylomonas]AMK76635.1 hypothetical protein JT25_009055 [Methylomonas denitrificans]OAH96291.1 hypothetical protein A1342_22710 [Methylomonas methanica]TCV73153.1 hypothetical protein EDE11_1458 [Methylomonas methanica]